jgi:hypothetical protein
VKLISKRLTYANVMSSIAVFLVLGGGAAYAAKKIGSNEIKGNSITTGKLKKEAVSSAKIKKNAITTAKIQNAAITGAKVNLGTLGTVPSATHATNADNATNWSRYSTSGLVRASAGQNVALLNIGPFSIVGHCKDAGGGELEAFTTIATSQVGSSMASYEISYFNSNFNPGTEAELAYSVRNSTPETSLDYYPGYENSYTAASNDGKTLLSGEAYNAVFSFGSQCAFWTHATNDA